MVPPRILIEDPCPVSLPEILTHRFMELFQGIQKIRKPAVVFICGRRLGVSIVKHTLTNPCEVYAYMNRHMYIHSYMCVCVCVYLFMYRYTTNAIHVVLS